MKTENILALTKKGIDYAWFEIVTTNNTKLTVYDFNLKWEIDNSQKEAEILILETDESGQVTQAIIRAKKKEIKNFMYTIGYGISSQKSDSVYQHTVIELQSRMQTMMWEMEELKQQLELKLLE
jgi:NADH/NAD ratio-sensing transcriptional regulator Rex